MMMTMTDRTATGRSGELRRRWCAWACSTPRFEFPRESILETPSVREHVVDHLNQLQPRVPIETLAGCALAARGRGPHSIIRNVSGCAWREPGTCSIR